MSRSEQAQNLQLSPQEKARQVAAQIEAKRRLVENLQQQVAKLTASESSLASQVETLTQEKATLVQELNTQKGIVAQRDSSINELTSKNTYLNTNLATANQSVSQLQNQAVELRASEEALKIQIRTLTEEIESTKKDNLSLTNDLKTANSKVEHSKEANAQLREKFEAVQSLDLSLTKFEESLQSINKNILSIVSSDPEAVSRYLELPEGTSIDEEYNRLVFSDIANINQVPEVLKSLFIENGFNSESLNLEDLVELRESLRSNLQTIAGIENLVDIQNPNPYLEKKLKLYNSISEVLDKLVPNR